MDKAPNQVGLRTDADMMDRALRAAPSTRTAEKSASDTWFLRPGAQGGGKVRLFCFPSAGFGAAMYRQWINAFPGQIDVYPVQPPGRGNRMTEPPIGAIPDLVDAFLPAILPLTDKPYAFFGHSKGSIFAAFAAEAIREAGARGPDHLFLSARQPPDVPSPVPPLAHLEDDPFVAEINRRYGGIPDEILRERDILAMLLPALRADVGALEKTEGQRSRDLGSPITVYGGESDAIVSRDLLEPWENWTNGGFRLRMFPGGHFYLDPEREAVLADIAETLNISKPGKPS